MCVCDAQALLGAERKVTRVRACVLLVEEEEEEEDDDEDDEERECVEGGFAGAEE